MKDHAHGRVDDEQEHAVPPPQPAPLNARQLAAAVGNQAFARMVARAPDQLAGTLHPAVAKLARKAPTTTIDFEPETVTGHVRKLDPTAVGDARLQIKADMLTLYKKMDNTQKAMTGGIDNFLLDQVFAGSSEGEADFNGVFLKYAGKKMLDYAIGKIGDQIPYFKPIYDFTFGLIEELEKEGARAETAKGELAVGKFIRDYRDKVINGFNSKIEAADAAEGPLITQYETIAAGSPELSKPTLPSGAGPGAQPAVAGDAAQFLTKLRQLVNDWRVPSSQDCLQLIVEEWIKSSEGDLMSRGGGDIYSNGRISLKAELQRDGDKWSVTKRPTSGKLVTNRADKVIKSIEHVLGAGKTINDLNIEKWLTIEVEDEIDWAGNDRYIVQMSWRTLDDVTTHSIIGKPVSRETMAKAPAIGERAIKELDLTSINVTSLSPGGGGRKV